MATLDPHLVLGAYATGVFPMADSRDAGSVFWVEPRPRAILPLDRFRVTRSLRKTIAADRFRVNAAAAFAAILALFAVSVPNSPHSWTTPTTVSVFNELIHRAFSWTLDLGARKVGVG